MVRVLQRSRIIAAVYWVVMSSSSFASHPVRFLHRYKQAQSRLRHKLNRVDFRIFHVAGESNGEFPVGDFHRHGFDVGAVRTTGFDPNVKILEIVSLHIEGENALASAADAV